MRHPSFTSMAILAIAMASVVGVGARGQAPAAAARTSSVASSPDIWAGWNPPRTNFTPPRTPDGQPDLQGIYEWPSGTRGDDAEEGAPPASAAPASAAPPTASAAGTGGRRGPGGARTGDGSKATGDGPEFWYEVSFNPDGTPVKLNRPVYRTVNEPPLYQPWAKAKQAYIRANENKELRILDPIVRCLRRGVPRTNSRGAYVSVQLVQAPGKVTVFYEWGHDSRVIYLDGRPHPGSDIKLWMGNSRGHWEGNTLVVDVTNFNDKTWLGGTGSGTFHSDALHVVERYTPMDKDQVYYEVWISDPNVLEKPYRQSLVFTKAWQPGYQQLEYACHEGNKAVDNILDGAANLALPPDQRK